MTDPVTEPVTRPLAPLERVADVIAGGSLTAALARAERAESRAATAEDHAAGLAAELAELTDRQLPAPARSLIGAILARFRADDGAEVACARVPAATLAYWRARYLDAPEADLPRREPSDDPIPAKVLDRTGRDADTGEAA